MAGEGGVSPQWGQEDRHGVSFGAEVPTHEEHELLEEPVPCRTLSSTPHLGCSMWVLAFVQPSKRSPNILS